jgi:hypothetical protein
LLITRPSFYQHYNCPVFGLGLALTFVILAALLLGLGLAALVLAPLLAGQVAAATARPKLERRASGPERMRRLIEAQRTERARRSALSRALTRTGIALAALSVLLLVAGLAAWIAGY